jgi:glycosyltransferase involved in cell wall biosynthesis
VRSYKKEPLPQLTVAIAAYNRPIGLERAARSILGEQGLELELLVSDNDSPEPEVAAVCARLAALDPRVRILRHAKHVPIYQNFLRTIAAARGQYILLLADDDWLRPGALWALVQTLQEQRQRGLQPVVAPVLRVVEAESSEAELDDSNATPYYPNGFDRLSSSDVRERIARYFAGHSLDDAHLVYALLPRATLERCWRFVLDGAERLDFMDLLATFGVLLEHPVVVVPEAVRIVVAQPSAAGRTTGRPMSYREFVAIFDRYRDILAASTLPEAEQRALRPLVDGYLRRLRLRLWTGFVRHLGVQALKRLRLHGAYRRCKGWWLGRAS